MNSNRVRIVTRDSRVLIGIIRTFEEEYIILDDCAEYRNYAVEDECYLGAVYLRREIVDFITLEGVDQDAIWAPPQNRNNHNNGASSSRSVQVNLQNQQVMMQVPVQQNSAFPNSNRGTGFARSNNNASMYYQQPEAIQSTRIARRSAGQFVSVNANPVAGTRRLYSAARPAQAQRVNQHPEFGNNMVSDNAYMPFPMVPEMRAPSQQGMSINRGYQYTSRLVPQFFIPLSSFTNCIILYYVHEEFARNMLELYGVPPSAVPYVGNTQPMFPGPNMFGGPVRFPGFQSPGNSRRSRLVLSRPGPFNFLRSESTYPRYGSTYPRPEPQGYNQPGPSGAPFPGLFSYPRPESPKSPRRGSH